MGTCAFPNNYASKFHMVCDSCSNDILRTDSVTPIVDAIGSFCQIFFIIALCILQRKSTPKIQVNPLIIIVIASVILYFTGWIFYYIGVTNPLIILLLTIPPCSAFIFLAIDRKNIIALIPAIAFTICHITYAIIVNAPTHVP